MKRYIKSVSIGIGFKSLVFAIALLGLYSCEKDIYITPPPYTSQIAFSAMVSNSDSFIMAYVGHNYGILEDIGINESIILNSAVVSVYKDGVLFDTIPQVTGLDSLNGRPIYGYYKKYSQSLNDIYGNANIEIRVSHPDYPSCSVTAKLPNEVPLQQVRYVQNAGTINNPFDGNPQTYDGAEITFTDPANEENYYEVGIVQNIPSWDSLYYYDNAIGLPESSDMFTRTIIFSDKDFNGSLYRKMILFETGYLHPNQPIKVVWRNISKEKYIYRKSLSASRNSNGNPFAEPANIYGNVQNGLGIFSIDRKTKYLVQ